MIRLVEKNLWKEQFFNSDLLLPFTEESRFIEVFNKGTYRHVREQIDDEIEDSRETI